MTAGHQALAAALRRVLADLGVPDVDPEFQRPRDTGHGDVATNVAMQLAGRLRQAPRKIAEDITSRLTLPGDLVTKIEVAGPGFINFWLADLAVADVVETILRHGSAFGRSASGRGRTVNVEFVSANPTGPLHVGHGRGAALGDALASVLEATGHEVTREFYVNDAGVQIDRLAQSLWARVQEAVGRPASIPENGYHGEYVVEMARRLLETEDEGFADLPPADALARCRDFGVQWQREEQRRDLEEFGVVFDVYFSESSLYADNAIHETLAELSERKVVYERDGALWLRTTQFGDDKDRVLRKSDGTYTYFTPDIAYHRTKAARGANVAIDVWGADHHGYIDRMRAALTALGLPEGFFQVALVQLVRVVRQGEEIRFSKRSGEFVTLRDLFEQAGVDAARYFFLMRKGDAQFVFDIDLATRQTDENPVYYVQYAHTRMAGIFRTAGVEPASVSADHADLGRLNETDEQDLMKRLAEYPQVVEKAAETLEPHRIIGYLEDIARLVNGWYHRHRVLGDDDALMQARLCLARAAQIVLANGLTLLGITAPERM